MTSFSLKISTNKPFFIFYSYALNLITFEVSKPYCLLKMPISGSTYQSGR
ncbi:hypothetical protein VCRA2122O266_600004 [Vibrio crassostreae]|nr:hypothetical protein VCRA2110O180_620004 [Vibrio crassostreae]CAK2197488.1 hypothetical protein VCRA2110O172_600004 [Vibrio crassostreae]CAK2959330.1 hypothetical protein VCRA2110O174_570001 [Vibrio crassostreae]CAK3547749.1 hypothetical protein VCRA2123O281_630004 [Vibrio crassostreae]CAK3614744.1 hypothetical protein VCRA2122O266_600004 [Vibrio crassostreae]